MTPKEKAKELFDKFYNVDACDEHYGDNYDMCSHMAKKCALIAVDEIIKSWEQDGNRRLDSGIIHWWHQVKEEIKNIQ